MVQQDVRLQQRDRRPLYLQVQEAIVQLIETRGLGVGDTIPSEPELSRMLDVGRSTVREAMMHLENAGIVERKRGVGTTLTSLASQPELGLEVLEPLEDLSRRQGWRCDTKDLTVEVRDAADDLARKLAITPGSAVTVISRTKTRGGEPFAVMESFIPKRTATLDDLHENFSLSVIAMLTETGVLRYARAEVSTVLATAALARRLEIKRGEPVITLEELCFGGDDLPLVWNMNYFVPGTIRLDILRRLPASGRSARGSARR